MTNLSLSEYKALADLERILKALETVRENALGSGKTLEVLTTSACSQV